MSVLIVAGVSGSGKTTIGRGVAARCHAEFVDGDDLHPPANVAKMHEGIPLTDADREPWLDAIRARIVASIKAREPLVVAASCLERDYRRHLVGDSPPKDVRIAFLVVSFETAHDRAEHRHHAFFPESLVRSQFATLEMPGADEPNVHCSTAAKRLTFSSAKFQPITCPLEYESRILRGEQGIAEECTLPILSPPVNCINEFVKRSLNLPEAPCSRRYY